VYASVGGGIEVPAGNETDPVPPNDTATALNPLLDPIRSTTYEIGTKRVVSFDESSVLGEIRYDLALYHTAVADEIVPYHGGRFYLTAGRVRRRGIELGARVSARGGVSLQTALTWTDHRYTHYVVDSVHYLRPGFFADYSGNRVVGVPSFTAALALDIAPAVVEPLRVRLAVDATSSYFADDANQVKVPSYRIAALTLATEARAGMRGFVSIHNLFDRRYIASAFLNPDVVGGEPVAFEPGLGRSFVVGLSLGAR
jgi:iron complex outermembrane receptor protein